MYYYNDWSMLFLAVYISFKGKLVFIFHLNNGIFIYWQLLSSKQLGLLDIILVWAPFYGATIHVSGQPLNTSKYFFLSNDLVQRILTLVFPYKIDHLCWRRLLDISLLCAPFYLATISGQLLNHTKIKVSLLKTFLSKNRVKSIKTHVLSNTNF